MAALPTDMVTAASTSIELFETVDDVVIVSEVTRQQQPAPSQQHTYAQAQVIEQVSAYAAANGLLWSAAPALHLADRSVVRPDVALNVRAPGTRLLWAPTALFEIEAAEDPCERMIEKAASLFTHLTSVECVVCLKLFAPRCRLLHEHHQLRVPALAVVFRCARGAKTVQGNGELHQVRVVESQSFGNEAVEPAALECFRPHTAHALLEAPLESVNDLTVASAALPESIDAADLEHSLQQALSRAQRAIGGGVGDALLHVPMPAPLPAIVLDLSRVFVAALLGWGLDASGAASERSATVATDEPSECTGGEWCLIRMP